MEGSVFNREVPAYDNHLKNEQWWVLMSFFIWMDTMIGSETQRAGKEAHDWFMRYRRKGHEYW